MAKRQNIIEFNGNRYDAHSGALIESSAAKPVISVRRPSVIDGVIPAKAKKTAAVKRSPPVSQAVHAKTSKSQTLMRHAVSKPAPTPKHHVAKKSPATNYRRLARAEQIAKSNLVSRFGEARSVLIKKIEPVSVVEAPEPPNLPTPNILPKNALSLSPFETALKQSESHKQPKLARQKRRHRIAKKLQLSPKTLNVGASVMIAIIVGGVIAYRSAPGMSIRLAGARAGINAALPSYRPAGFKIAGPAEYAKGKVAINFKSNADNRGFRMTQEKSDWNSQNLLKNYVSKVGQHQTVTEKGRTIYVYGDDNATWVNGGVWYKIEGASGLNTEQLTRIATSL